MPKSLMLLATIFMSFVTGCCTQTNVPAAERPGDIAYPLALLLPTFEAEWAYKLTLQGRDCGDHRFEKEIESIGRDALSREEAAFKGPSGPMSDSQRKASRRASDRLKEISKAICQTP